MHYSFHCTSCGHQVVKDLNPRQYRDLPSVDCEKCGAKMLRDYTGGVNGLENP